jgi:hypothetical protein
VALKNARIKVLEEENKGLREEANELRYEIYLASGTVSQFVYKNPVVAADNASFSPFL